MKILIKWKNGNIKVIHRELLDGQISIIKSNGGIEHGAKTRNNKGSR
jgi:hypothetical protein